jgi:hypothetical protein
MRIIFISVAALGLALIVCAGTELSRISQYRATVRQVQAKVAERDQNRLRELRRFNVAVTEFPSMDAILSELDTVGGLEKGWWVVLAAGGGVCMAGVVGLAQAERLRRASANNLVVTGPL